MADYDRNWGDNRGWDRERRQTRGRDWNRENRFEDERLDDRTGSSPGSSGGYSASQSRGVDRGIGGYGSSDDRGYYGGQGGSGQGGSGDYGRDDQRSSRYGGFEERSFSSREERSGYGGGGGDPYGYDSDQYRSRSAREYQTNRNLGMRGNADSEGFGGRYSAGQRGRSSYDFSPQNNYGIGSEFGFGHDVRGSQYERGGRYYRDQDHDHERGAFSHMADHVRSWFGDDEARARVKAEHRGRGPKGYTRSDDRIREDVSDRLTEDAWLDASDIEVMVTSCEVTLSGTVNSRDDKRRAEDLAEQVSGVKHVQNNLRVSQMDRPGGLSTADASARGVTSDTSGGFGSTSSTGSTGSTTDNSALTKQAQGKA